MRAVIVGASTGLGRCIGVGLARRGAQVLRRSRGAVAYLTSTSASLTQPWPGLAAYAASKAALDKMVEAWRAEHADIGFTRVIVGECAGGEGHGVTHFMDEFDQDLAAKLIPVWLARGLMASTLLDVEDLVGVIDGVLRAGASASLPSVAVLPRQPPLKI